MQPKTLSATALDVSRACLARYKAEHVDRGRAIATQNAASLGSAVHGALEMFVKATRPELNPPQLLEPSLDLLLDLFKMSYMTVFGTADTASEEFEEGVEMLKRWHARTSWDGVTVLSAERKSNFPVPTPIGPIPFNYIWDRCDRIGESTIRVVDYKSNRQALRPEDLIDKVQARCYGVAGAIFAKDCGFEVTEVWIVFDMLRHDPVGIVFDREKNTAAWRFIKAEAKRIVEADPDRVKETPNPSCTFCVRKAQCGELAKNVTAGGVLGLGTLEDKIDRRAHLDSVRRGVERAIEEIDLMILSEAEERDIVSHSTPENIFEVTMSGRRAVDAERVEALVGKDLFEKYGGVAITMGQLDKLKKDKELPADKKKALDGLIYTKRGEPKVSTKPRNPIDE